MINNCYTLLTECKNLIKAFLDLKKFCDIEKHYEFSAEITFDNNESYFVSNMKLIEKER